jgi:hypothetical protein
MASRRIRDYHAEYARRKALAAERGLSTAQARGHPRHGETGVDALKRLGTLLPGRDRTLEKYYDVVGELREGWSLRQATAVEGMSPRTFWRLNAERGMVGKQYYVSKRGQILFDRYTVAIPARMPILTTANKLLPHVPLDEKNASLIGTYWNAVDKAMQGDAQALRDLRAFAYRTIYDTYGHRYQLQTDLNALFRFFDQMTAQEHADFLRTFYTGREVVYGAA